MTAVLIVGSGGREHALAWKLNQSPDVDTIFVAPGNAGTAKDAKNVPIAVTDVPGLVSFARERDIYLTIIGPEEPITLGLADALRAENRLVVGPGAAAARIESSKSFAKNLMRRSGVPTAGFRSFTDPDAAHRYLAHASYPLVVKADGLAAGKGVTVCDDEDQARESVHALMIDRVHGMAGQRILIEEMLSGPEISLLAFVDGSAVVPLPLAQDHKRLGDGDSGPNTGGMGAYAPVRFVGEAERDALAVQVMQPIVDALSRDGIPYRGILFAGLMLTADGPRVLEFNCRFGDPETQAILPLLADDLFPWLQATAAARLEGIPRILPGVSSVGVVLASPGYPGPPVTGIPIEGLDGLAADTLVFHSGTSLGDDGRVATAGGRVLTIVGTGRSVEDATRRAYASPVRFEGMQRRMDIAWQVNSPLSAVSSAGRLIPASRIEIPPVIEREPSWSDRPTAETGGGSIAVLASGSGTNLQSLLYMQARGALEAEITVVISHNPAAEALKRASHAGITALTVPLANRRNSAVRARFESELLDALAPYRPDLIVLAGWMVILSGGFLDRCGCPVINVHPALLDVVDIPIVRGQHAVRDALALGIPYTGVTVHYVTADVDAGPVILSEEVMILPGDTEETLYARIKPVEHRLLPLAVQTVLHARYAGGVYA